MRRITRTLIAIPFLALPCLAQVEGEAPYLPHHDGRTGEMPDRRAPLDYKEGIVPVVARRRVLPRANAIPWSWQPTRYQQVYRGDELPMVLPISYMSFRNNLRTDTGATVDVEILLGTSAYDQTSLTNAFASNWTPNTTPTTVLTRKKIVVPNMVANLDPGRFHFEIKLDRVFAWRRAPNTNLLTEIVVYGNSNNNANYLYYLNAESQSTTTRLYAYPNTASPTGTLSVGYGLVTQFHAISQKTRQIGTVELYGKGCVGTGTGPGQDCIVVNPNQTALSTGTLANHTAFALECVAPGDTLIRGVELFCSGPTTNMSVQFMRADASGKRPLTTPVALTTAQVTPTASWVKASWPKPIPVLDGERFYVTFVTFPGLQIIGASGVQPRYFWTNTANWNGPWEAFEFSYKVECVTPSAIPSIRSGEEPTIACPHEIGLDFAKPSSAALLVFGAARVNVDLGSVGATGCTLLASLDVIVPVPTDARGSVSLKLPVPNDKALIGAKLRNQWAVLDPSANLFGFVFTRGQEMVVGGL